MSMATYRNRIALLRIQCQRRFRTFVMNRNERKLKRSMGWRTGWGK